MWPSRDCLHLTCRLMGEMTRLLYIDDSGSVNFGGLVVYGWVEVDPAGWRVGLRAWLNLRKELFREYGIPVSEELHATEFVNGRSRISVFPPTRFQPTPGLVLWKDLGREVALKCLATLRDCPHIRTGAVYRWTGLKGSAYSQARHDLYHQFIQELDAELAAADSFGFVTMDGTDTTYRNAHRALKLDTRHLIEDPAMHDSRHSQWTQMADLVAYSANLHLNRHPGNQFGWNWYTDYLAGSDPHGGPQERP
jgi:hypothetical protein